MCEPEPKKIKAFAKRILGENFNEFFIASIAPLLFLLRIFDIIKTSPLATAVRYGRLNSFSFLSDRAEKLKKRFS